MESDLRNEARKAQALFGGGVGGALAPENYKSRGESPMMAESYGDDRAVQEPLSIRVERRLATMSTDAERLLRVKAILQQHPEFETFIEFNELLNRARLR